MEVKSDKVGKSKLSIKSSEKPQSEESDSESIGNSSEESDSGETRWTLEEKLQFIIGKLIH